MTQIQKIALTIAVLGFVAGSGAQLQDILAPLGAAAPLVVKEIVSLTGFISGILGVVLSFTTGQASQVKAVQDMPGVSSITVDPSKANSTLKTLVDDPAMEKIDYAPSTQKPNP